MAAGVIIFAACFVVPIALLFAYSLCKAAKIGDMNIRRIMRKRKKRDKSIVESKKKKRARK